MRSILIVIISLFSASLLFGQQVQQVYQMKALGKKIGTALVKKRTEGDNTFYHTQSVLEVNLLFKTIRMEVDNQTQYRFGRLYKSIIEITVNGKEHASSSIIWDGHQYNILIDGEKQSPMTSEVFFSGTLLYFQEPSNIDQAFSETSGQYMSVSPSKEGQYTVTDLRNNRDMLHFYEDGKLVKIKVKHPLVTVSLDLIESKMPSK